MTPEVPPFRTLPDAVQQTLHDLEKSFSLRFRVSQQGESGEPDTFYVSQGLPPGEASESLELDSVVRGLNPRDGPDLELRIYGVPPDQRESLPDLVAGFLGRTFEFAQEVRFFIPTPGHPRQNRQFSPAVF